MRGRLILVVGPSGAGKDTLIQGARRTLAADSRFAFPRRRITRPPDPNGENHVEISEGEYEAMAETGGYCLHWRAHGLCYGLPAAIADDLANGVNVVANVSRAVVSEARRRLDPVHVIQVEASPELLVQRLATRGRESTVEQRLRLDREAALIPEGIGATRFVNADGVEQEVARFTALLRDLSIEGQY